MKPPPGSSWLNPETGRYEANGCYWTGTDWKKIADPPDDDSEPPGGKPPRSLPGVGVKPPPGAHPLNPETMRYEANGCYWDGERWKQIDDAAGTTTASLLGNRRFVAGATAAGVVAIVIGLGVVALRGAEEPPPAVLTAPVAIATTTASAIDQARLDELEATVAAAASSRALAAETSRAAAAAAASAAAVEENRRAMELQQAAANAQMTKFDRSTYSVVSERDYGLVVRDPQASAGRRLVVHGYVTQFDTKTGPSSFRADTAATLGSGWYDFDVNTIVNFDPVIAGSVIKGDVVTMYVEVVGTTTYNTTFGTKETAPVLKAHIIDIQ